jgi:hypothetical protein
MSLFFKGDWLIDYLQFYVSLKNFSLIWRRHHCRWRAAKFRPFFGAQGLWAGRDFYRATPTVTRDLGFSGFIRMTAPFSHLLQHTRGCGGSILTRILTWFFKGEGLRVVIALYQYRIIIVKFTQYNWSMFVCSICLFVWSRTSNFSAIWQLSQLPVAGLQI